MLWQPLCIYKILKNYSFSQYQVCNNKYDFSFINLISRLLNSKDMSNTKDIIIIELEAELDWLKKELAILQQDRDEIKRNFDELKVILRETWIYFC